MKHSIRTYVGPALLLLSIPVIFALPRTCSRDPVEQVDLADRTLVVVSPQSWSGLSNLKDRLSRLSDLEARLSQSPEVPCARIEPASDGGFTFDTIIYSLERTDTGFALYRQTETPPHHRTAMGFYHTIPQVKWGMANHIFSDLKLFDELGCWPGDDMEPDDSTTPKPDGDGMVWPKLHPRNWNRDSGE